MAGIAAALAVCSLTAWNAIRRALRRQKLLKVLPLTKLVQSVTKEQEEAVLSLLREHEHSGAQGHVLAQLSDAQSENDIDAMLRQLSSLHSTLEGGLSGYVWRARRLLQAHRHGEPPFKEYTRAEVPPAGAQVQYGTPEHTALETRGQSALKEGMAFVLVAGGIGERLGYSGQSKLELPTELSTNTCFLQLFIETILALQHEVDSKLDFPLAIMTSDDTHDAVVRLLERNDYFGASREQVHLLKQQKVPCFRSYAADLALSSSEQLPLLDEKPHGHGDIHNMLFNSGLAKQWKRAGFSWLFFFQDTNPLAFKSLLSALGTAKAMSLAMCSVAIPRTPKEAIGGIAKLSKPSGKSITVNVEYSVLDAFLRTSGWPEGDVAVGHEQLSPFPGNINQLCFELDAYVETLTRTKGMVPELINPKLANDGASFKKPTRTESLMQDFALLLKHSQHHGFVQMQAMHSYSPVKNSPEDARKKEPSHSATTSELDTYRQHCYALRAATSASIDRAYTATFNGIHNCEVWPLVVLHPSFAPAFDTLQAKVHGGHIRISSRSVLVIKGGSITIKRLDLDGALIIEAAQDANVEIDASVSNSGWKLDPLIDVDNSSALEIERLRGFRINKMETKVARFTEAGWYKFTGASKS